MSSILKLGISDQVIEEPGFVSHHLCRENHQDYELHTGKAVLERHSQALMLAPIYHPIDTRLGADSDQWTAWHEDDEGGEPGTGNWEETQGVFGESGYWLHQRNSAANKSWYAESNFELEANEAFYATWCLMTPPSDQTDHQITLHFGGRYQLLMKRSQDAVLYRLTDGEWQAVGRGEIVNDPRDFYNRQIILHVIPIKRKYIRFRTNFCQTGWLYAEDEDRIEVEELHPGEPDTRKLHKITLPGTVKIEGNGGAGAFAFRRQKYETDASVLSPVIVMPYQATQMPETEVDWEVVHSGSGAILSVLDAQGHGWVPGEEGKSSFRYRVGMAGPGEWTPFIYKVQIKFPPKLRTRTETEKDLYGVTLELTESLSLDTLSQNMEFTIKDVDGLYREIKDRANMKLYWEIDGAKRFTGLTDEPDFQQGPQGFERIRFTCSDTWKKLRNTRLWHTGAFDGYKHTKVFKAVCKLAGFQDDDLDVADDDYQLPKAEDDEPPLFKPHYGTESAEFLEYLRQHFSGWRMGSRPDGKIYYQPGTASAPVQTFYTTTVSAQASNGKKCYSWSERINEQNFANWIIVCGRDVPRWDADKQEWLAKPAMAWWRDEQSYSDQDYPYYVGEWRLLLYVDSSLRGQAAVNWACAKLAAELGHFQAEASAEVDFVKERLPGDVITIEGKSNWQIRSMQTRIKPKLERSRVELRKVT